VNDHIRTVCHRLAEAGYVALAPELFHRTGAGIEIGYEEVMKRLGAGESMTKVLPFFAELTNTALKMDLVAGIAALRNDTRVDPAQVGVIGFCLGGFATFLAAEETDAAAFVAFYGGGIVHARPGLNLTPLLDNASRIQAPLLLVFGEQDQSI